MKKFFKKLLVCSLLLPCVFMLTACGKNKDDVSVNTKGNYVATTQTETYTMINDSKANENFDFTGFRATMVMTTYATAMAQESSLKMNVTYVGGENAQFKVNMTNNGVETNVYLKDGYYYLFGSAGSCCEGASSTYHVVYGRATNLMGPYVNKAGGTMLNNQAETLLSGNDFVAGPGHNAEFVEDDKNQTWIIYHGYIRDEADQGRCVFLDQVKWKDGWPYMDSDTPSRQSAAPYFNN